MRNPLDLAERTVVVTGASSGIGRDTAILLSALGAHVVLTGRDEERLKITLQSLEGFGHQAEIFDFAASLDVCGWLRNIRAKCGPVHGLVHCAGIHVLQPLRAITRRTVDTTMQISVNTAIELAKGFSERGFSVPGGSMVLLASVAGLTGQAGTAAYTASKGAIVALTRALAMELARQHLRVNCVAPGLVRTPMGEELLERLSPQQLTAMENEYPLGFGSPRDVSHAIAFLLADTARWITGSVLVVDGGYSTH